MAFCGATEPTADGPGLGNEGQLSGSSFGSGNFQKLPHRLGTAAERTLLVLRRLEGALRKRERHVDQQTRFDARRGCHGEDLQLGFELLGSGAKNRSP